MKAEHAQKDMLRLVDDLPVIFVWAADGKEYRGTRGAHVTSKRLTEGGIFTEHDLTITVALKKMLGGRMVNTFPTSTLPKADQRILHVGGRTNHNFRIERVTEDEYQSAIQLDCMSDADTTREQTDYEQGGNFSGSGSPEGVVLAKPGAKYVDVDSGDPWIKKTGDRTKTGWVREID